jgi:hypothetical protein
MLIHSSFIAMLRMTSQFYSRRLLEEHSLDMAIAISRLPITEGRSVLMSVHTVNPAYVI